MSSVCLYPSGDYIPAHDGKARSWLLRRSPSRRLLDDLGAQ
jgi:hypothetical protein